LLQEYYVTNEKRKFLECELLIRTQIYTSNFLNIGIGRGGMLLVLALICLAGHEPPLPYSINHRFLLPELQSYSLINHKHYNNFIKLHD
jgi:hypothetical protein